MSGFFISIKVVIPIFLLILLGSLFRRMKWVDEATLTKMDKLGFRVFLPAQLFFSLYRANNDFSAYQRPLLFSVLIIMAIFAISLVAFSVLEKDPRRRGPMIQCEIRVNFVIFGMAVIASLYGAENTGLIAVISAVIIPLTSTIAAILFEIYRGSTASFRKLLLNIIKNPYLIGAVLGLLFMLLGIRLPNALETVISDLGSMATPYCLIVLGGCIHLSSLRGYGRSLWMAVIGKSLLIPLIFIPIVIALGFRGEALATLAVMLACPTAVSGFTLAKQCGADGELAGQLVVVTTLCSVFTIFFVIWILTAQALI